MGLFSFVKNQFIEVIEWTDSTNDTIVYCFPVANKEIKMGAKLTVRESQVAIFVNEGQIADVYGPGLYELTTENMPIMTKLKSWKYGFNSPFKAEVYFVNTKQFTDQKWGTANPIMMRDAEFGMLRLRAFGIFSYRVNNPATFMREIFGTSQNFDTEAIYGQLKRSLITVFTDVIGESKIPAIDLAAYYEDLSEKTAERVNPKFEALGLSLTSLFIENISLPEEVEKVLDKKTSMGVLGDLGAYTQYQTAEAIRDAANNPGNIAGNSGIGIGAGIAMGNAMGNAMNASFSRPQEKNQKVILCPHCGKELPSTSKFCPECGKQTVSEKIKCPKCGADIDRTTKFCPECGTKIN